MLQRLGYVGASAFDSKVENLPISDNGLDAVRATLKKMAALVRKYSGDATTGTAAREILTAGGVTDIRKNRQARLSVTLLQNFVRDQIAYIYDPVDWEWIQTPPKTLQLGTGDCDDKSILLNAMLASVGFQTEFLAVGGSGPGWGGDGNPTMEGLGEDFSIDAAPQAPPFSHVLSAVKLGSPTGRRPWYLDGWLPCETIVPGAEPGWLPPGIQVILPWRI